jgi:hypothetical protein
MAAIGGRHVAGTPYRWSHGWHPLNKTTALKYKKPWSGKSGHSKHRKDMLTRPAPKAPKRQPEPPRDVRTMSDAELETQLMAAMGDHFDEKSFERVSAEIDRRESEKRARDAIRTRNRQAAERRRANKEAKQAAHLSELLDSGMDEEEAVAEAYGTSIDRQRRTRAIDDLRGQGYSGKGFDELARKSYRDHIYRQWFAAENATRGVLFNKAGLAAGVDERALFNGPESRARKYASDELKSWWDQHGRMTFAEYRAQLLADSTAARTAREAQKGDFLA